MHHSSVMAGDEEEDEYELDAQGRCVLVGLTAEETDEFIRLDEADFLVPSPLLLQEWSRPEEKRWLELLEKHDLAIQPYLAGSKTKH
jgi:hypothetical protein